MIALVERLIARGVAYQADDGSVYFAIARFPQYGRLSRLDTRELKAGARVSQDDYSKENAQDFAVWKAATDQDETAGRRVGLAVGSGPPGLAPRVLRDGDGAARRDDRPALRRRGSHLPAPRGRDRAE
jgi:cysteinyl-tRNA synthetase